MELDDILAALDDVSIGRHSYDDVLAGDASGVLESLGAISPGQAAALAKKMATARAINPDAVMVNKQMWKRVRKCQAGTTIVSFTAGTPAQDVQLQVLRPFLPMIVMCSSVFAPFFRISKMEVNGDNQLGALGPIECQTISEAAAQRPIVEFDTVNTSLPMIISVVMTDLTKTRDFSLTFNGIQLRK